MVRHREHPLGQVRARDDVKALVDKTNRDGPLDRGGQGALGITGHRHPGVSRGVKKTFFDGKVFDPNDHMAYLKSLSIKRAVV